MTPCMIGLMFKHSKAILAYTAKGDEVVGQVRSSEGMGSHHLRLDHILWIHYTCCLGGHGHVSYGEVRMVWVL